MEMGCWGSLGVAGGRWGLLGVAGMMITSDDWDHSRKFPCVKRTSKMMLHLLDPFA